MTKTDNSTIIIRLLIVIIVLIIGFALIYYFCLYPPKQTANKCKRLIHDMEQLNPDKDLSSFYQMCLNKPDNWLSTDPAIKQ